MSPTLTVTAGDDLIRRTSPGRMTGYMHVPWARNIHAAAIRQRAPDLKGR